MKRRYFFLFSFLTFLMFSVFADDSIQSGFVNPPASAKPQTWWHWINGNISKDGITADLEAMKRVGIQEAQVFNVDMGYPEGSAPFLSSEWLELFKYAASEAKRLGLGIGFHNGAGWSSSGGPWITPEYAMQKVVYSEVQHKGGKKFKGRLPLPPVKFDYYVDIAVFAFPEPQGDKRIDDQELKTLSGHSFRNHLEPDMKQVAESDVIRSSDIVNLTSKISAEGMLEWDAPEGDWIILRLGHTPTGAENRPAVASGRGLECDKMSRAAVDAHWEGAIKPILDKLGPLVGSSLTNCIIDSYEVGCNNWTSGFDKKFEQLRGYDCMPFLPSLAGYYVESGEITERFLWDFRRTIGDLITENYYTYFRERCHEQGLKFAVEPYGGPFECLQAGSTGDIVVSEFWTGSNVFFDSPRIAASIAHLNGNSIVGAEAFTGKADWLNHPATIKSVGDRAFAEGVNRMIFHSFVHQPRDRAPGLTLGPYGLEANRLNTWWEQGGAYMSYLARSQFLLQQGRAIADILIFAGESSPNDAILKPDIKAKGYDYDLIGTNKMASLIVRDGLICTSVGGKYRMLVLPETTFMTPELLRKIGELAKAGAIITGPKPDKSPSLRQFPQCDNQVSRLADELWDGGLITNRSIWDVLNDGVLPPDFSAGITGLDINFIHRIVGDIDIYFVANPQKETRQETCRFRVTGKQPEIWKPETGVIRDAAVWQINVDGTTDVSISFDPDEAVFVVFRKPALSDRIIHTEMDLDLRKKVPLPGLKIIKAEYGVFFPEGLADVSANVIRSIKDNKLNISAGNHLCSNDPAPGSIKELRVEYCIGDQKPQIIRALEHEKLSVEASESEELKITKAVYGKFDRGIDGIPSHYPVHDVTKQVTELVGSNIFEIMADDCLIEDLSDLSGRNREENQKNELRLVYSTEGETHRKSVKQGSKASLAINAPEPELIIENGETIWRTPYSGKITCFTSSGAKKTAQVTSIPEPIELTGSWQVSFPPDLGAPSKMTFEKLKSWTLFPDDGIRYFSGTATYRKQFVLTKDFINGGNTFELDLGRVCAIAEVFVNGKNLGIIWKAPFRIDLGNSVVEGQNELEVRVTNLWANRIIGDEQLKEGKDSTENSSKRITYTTQKYWNKDSPLQISGLLGPVIIRSYVRQSIF